MFSHHLLLGVLLGSAAAAPVLEHTIPLPGVKGRIDHLALDPAGERLFVAALGNGTIEIVDLKQGWVSQSLSGLAEPQGVLFIPELNRLHVACGGDGTVRVFDGTSLALVKAVALGDDADNLRYDGALRQVYVGYGGGELGVLDANTGAIFARLSLGAHPESFQLETKGPRIFVNLPSAHAIAVVDRVTQRLLGEWSPGMAAGNYPMALDEVRHRLYVACRMPARLLVFDTEAGREVARLDLHGDCDDLFLDDHGRRLYAACGEGFIDVFELNGTGLHPAESVKTEPNTRTCLVAGGRLYLAVPRRGGQPAEIRCYRL